MKLHDRRAIYDNFVIDYSRSLFKGIYLPIYRLCCHTYITQIVASYELVMEVGS